jgi:hypothetical protein
VENGGGEDPLAVYREAGSCPLQALDQRAGQAQLSAQQGQDGFFSQSLCYHQRQTGHDQPPSHTSLQYTIKISHFQQEKLAFEIKFRKKEWSDILCAFFDGSIKGDGGH